MDKLEKALQKARELRQSHAGGVTASHQQHQTMAHQVPTSKIDMQEKQLENNRILSYRTRSEEADIYRILRTQVLQVMGKEGYKTLAITSANYGEGKTTTALNLAISIALDQKQTVLLADMDFRKPNVHEYLGLDVTKGLTDCLLGHATVAECLVRLPFDRMTVLPAGTMIENSSETIGSPRMGSLADEMRSRYADRLIIYDMPPLLAQDDPLAFLPHVDCVLLVVQDGVTKTKDVKRCMEILESAKVIGTVLNNVI